MKINIAGHFAGLKQHQRELVAEAQARREHHAGEVARMIKERASLEAAKAKKEKLRRQNEEEGLDTAQLQTQILDLEVQIGKLEAEICTLQKDQEEASKIVARSFDREDLLADVLANVYNCREAEAVDCLEAIFQSLTVLVSQADGAGHPKQCIIVVGQETKPMLIKKAVDRWCLHFRPPALRWLGGADDETENHVWTGTYDDPDTATRHLNRVDEPLKVYFDRQSEKIVLTRPLEWRVNVKQQQYPYREETEYYKSAFDDISMQLGPVLDGLLAQHAELDLANEYAENPLMAHVRIQVMAQTTNECAFNESAGHLTSKEIYERIKVEWDGFINCPWSKKMRGTLAMTKYLVENGERARFWPEKLEGHYGLRLRTRDHDWIVGEIYIDPTMKADSEQAELVVHSIAEEQGHGRYYEVRGRWVASWRNMFLTVARG